MARTLSPTRFQTLIVVAVDVPAEVRTRMIGQHSSAYFEMQRTQARPPEDRWDRFSEYVQKADARQFAAMTFTVSKTVPSAPLVHGISVLYFPADFAKGQTFYCFMWMDQHLPNVEPGSADLAPLTVALASAGPAPAPLVETALSRLSELETGAASTPGDLGKLREEASQAVERTRHAQTYSSSIALKIDQVDIRWRVDVAAPDRYHVLQTSGPLSDEWITIGRHNYRSLVTQWFEKSIGEVELNTNFRVEKFLDIMTAAQPVAATESASGDDSYTVLDYHVIPKFKAASMMTGITGPADIRIWIDKRTGLVARGEMKAAVVVQGKSSSFVWRQVFTGYGVPLRIEPPVR